MGKAGVAIRTVCIVSVASIQSTVICADAPMRAPTKGCPSIQPVSEVAAEPIYADRAGSTIDSDHLHKNQQLIMPLRLYDRALADLLQGKNGNPPSSESLSCAGILLKNWANSGALLIPPGSFAAIRERQRFTIGINVAALKLKFYTKMLDDSIWTWLRNLNRAIVNDFEKRGIRDNLYIWSGVNAASFATLRADQVVSTYEEQVWRDGLAQIPATGYLPSELRRQSKALIYHQYYLSGLLFLRAFRSALGKNPTDRDNQSLDRLVNIVETSLCDKATIAKVAGTVQVDEPPIDQFAIGDTFGNDIFDERWERCGIHPLTFDIEELGGNLEDTYHILKANLYWLQPRLRDRPK